MRIILFAVLLIAGPIPHSRSFASANDLEVGDRKQIEAIFERWEYAWNTHDMPAFARLFHEDGIWIVWTGRVWKGRKEIEDGHVEAHKSFFRDSTQRSRPEEITLVGPGVVVARSITTLTGDTREPQATILGRKLLVITKRDGAWKISYGQNTRLAPPVAAMVK